ncbi:substrate-binding domain-containing protein [Silvibacterium sp.]|uniref:substrate-binding domain-containing protein n=1 Tax=Silvibacterium sp. TaxID=1964179 RepID=UPI0039E70474
MARTDRRLYLIPVLSKALDVLEILQNTTQPMTLAELHAKTRFSKTTVYRVMKTFVHRGYVAQLPDGSYRHVARQRKLCFGFAGQSGEMPFSNEVTASLKEAATRAGVELLVLDNRYDPKVAVENAEELIRRRVDLAIELQVDEEVAPIIGDRIAAANIPLIAVDIPHPNAVYFGVDNFRVGLEAGELLAKHAVEQWSSRVSWVLGLDLPEAGQLVQGRVSGAFEAVRRALPKTPPEVFVRMDGRGMKDRSQKLVAEFLAAHPKDRHILIAAATDTSALGAIAAIRAAKREKQVAVVGQDCIAEAVAEMKRPGSSLIGTVSHEAASYGPALIVLGMSLLRGQTVPPYNYVTHRTVTRESLAE